MSSASISQGSKGQPGILTLIITNNDQVVNTTVVIHKQNMLLQNVRVEMTSSAGALAEGVIYVEAPFWNSNLMIDNNVGYFNLPIFLDNAIVTLQNTLQMPVHIKQDIPEKFEVRILGANKAPLQGLVSIMLQFSFDGNLQA